MSAKSSNNNTHHHLGKAATRGVRSKHATKYRWNRLLLLPLWVVVAFLASNLFVGASLVLLDWLHLPLESYVRPAIIQTVLATIIYVLTISIVIGVPYLVKKRKTGLATLGLDRLPTWIDIGLAPAGFIVYSLATTAVLAAAIAWIPGFPVDQVQDIGFKALGSRSDNILAFATLVVLAPLAEETLFRGYLYGKLKGNVPAVWAAIATSLLFALAHFQWNVGLDVFVLSLVLCGLRSLTGSIWAGVLVHMIKNSIAYYILFIYPLVGG